MSLTSSLQVCMDSSLDWLQESIPEEAGMDSSSSQSEMDILTCSRPLLERRMRPPHEQPLECPRCHSAHTKFCYYNNYSLSQPRYFCKTCRRYWTNGGTLRNIPVGGGCRKNKKSSSTSSSSSNKKSSNDHPLLPFGSSSASSSTSSPSANPTDFQHTSFPEMMHFPHQMSSFHVGNPSFIGIENPTPIDFMDSKYGSLMDSASRNQDFLGNAEMGMMNTSAGLMGPRFPGLCSSYGLMSLDGNSSTAMPPYRHHENNEINNSNNNAIDVKPSADALPVEWQDQGYSDDPGKHSFGYINEMGTWTTFFMR